MKKLIVLSGLIFFGVGAWRIGGQLSSDAIGMALGVLFGVLAGLPVALLVLASNRRRERQDDDDRYGGYPGQQGRQQRALPPGYGYPMPVQQPPVIVLAGSPGGMQQGNGNGYGYNQPYPPQHMLPGPGGMQQEMPQERRYRVVGETEEWIEEW
ncbi:MAG TPA: hypothetical protein P5121_04360 [Caldilineaceae bacterium]|nr:hypothetical protein [Caldilineaceae bacterium]